MLGTSKATVYRRMRDPAVRKAMDRERSAVVGRAVRNLFGLTGRWSTLAWEVRRILGS
jgi:hypothetical protein